MLDDEVRTILRELLAATGGAAATIGPANRDQAAPPGARLRVAPLGGGAELRLDLGARPGDGDPGLGAAVEHAVRALRAAARRWDSPLPPVALGPAATDHATDHDRALARIDAYLGALAGLQHARNACVVARHRMIAWARPPEALDEARWPLLDRRAHAAAAPGTSSHGELVDPDVYAVTFWYGASLIVYFGGPFGVDFIRHRARLVTRELAGLLPMLDPDPGAPAHRLPVPP